MNSENKLEELKLDLMEIQAYRILHDETFCFDGVNKLKNESECSIDAYYENEEDNLLNNIEKLENLRKIQNDLK